MARRLKALAVLLAVLAATPLVASNPGQRVLIRSPKPYADLVAKVNSAGGIVTQQFKYVDAIAAEIPTTALATLQSIVGNAAVVKDAEIALPKPIDLHALKGGPTPTDDARNIASDSADAIDITSLASLAQNHPEAYLVNNGIANVSGLHAAGFTGSGEIVALIDAGIRPGFPHITGSVIGCEDFVNDGLGCSNSANDGHGTFVAGMIAAHVVFVFSPASAFRNAVLAECPGCFLNPPTFTQIPMIGTAPGASLYALRVFPPNAGAPSSRVITAMERVIDLRALYDAGDTTNGRKIDVCNMSLGGATLFAGRDLIDQEADALLVHGIVPVIAAGNAGPATLTIGSPGSSASAITVGAASLAHNERIEERVAFGPVVGNLYRPYLGTQIAFFSSRGPNADGRPDPDVVANGFDSFGQGFGAVNQISLGSGTSFATPSVSGIVAVLRQRFPNASAATIRNAVIATANPAIVTDGATGLDQGAGYVDAGAAAAALLANVVPGTLPTLGNANSSVKVNIEQGTDLVVRDGAVMQTFTRLQPGERRDVLYRVNPNTSQVIVILSGVTPQLPPDEQNQLFGDDILLGIHSAKTSSIGEGDYKVFTFTTGNSFAIADPEQGIMRVSVNGDWTNAGLIDATVTIFSVTDPLPGKTAEGTITQGQAFFIPVVIPAGTKTADFRLSWREDWGEFPTNDLDLFLIRPDSSIDTTGASLNSPEHVVVNHPAAGPWFAVVNGFFVPNPDKFELRVALDGKVVK